MHAAGSATHRIAWDGVDFPVPAEWELSCHGADRGAGSLVLEDSAEVRLQMDWAPAGEARACERVRRQREALVRRLDGLSKAAERLDPGVPGWDLERRLLRDGTGLVLGFQSGAFAPACVFVRLHAQADPDYPLAGIARRLVRDFRYHDRDAVPWRVYDLKVRVPRAFRLVRTSLLAGRKLLVFECRLRRLWIWRFSLAERLLHGRSAAETLVEELNRHPDFPGVRFHALPGGRLEARRRSAHPFGHRDEIGRWCFRYAADYRQDPASDTLLAQVFQYRHEADRDWLREVRLEDDSV